MSARLKWGTTPKGAGWLPVAPKGLPGFEAMFLDIGARPSELGAHLGVGMSSVYRWLGGQAECPRASLLAMFYETQWGRSWVAADVESDAVQFGRAMLILRAEVDRLRAELERVGRIADFGSANDPSGDVQALRMECRRVAGEVATWGRERRVA